VSLAKDVFAIDLDQDGDIDVLSASSGNDKIRWYENDGNQNFTPHDIATDADFAYSVYAADINGDGHLDVLSASRDDNKIAWYENDGNENFTTHIISTDAVKAISVFAGDVDGDGDIDVISASALDAEINWYENLSPVSVEIMSDEITNEFYLTQNYPNPFNPSTTLKFSLPENSMVTLKVYNIVGEEVATLLNDERNRGIYSVDFDASSAAG
jgi:hypothetical protein